MENFSLNNFDENAMPTGESPMLDPGSHYVRFASIALSPAPYDATKTFIDVTVEGVEVPVKGFTGLQIDRDNPTLGNFKGKAGFAKHDKFPAGDWTNKAGVFTSKNEQIFNWLGGLAKWMGVLDEMRRLDIGAGSTTIEEFTVAVSAFLCNPERWYMVTLGGREYTNNKGYLAHQLFIPRANRGKLPVVPRAEEGETPANFQAFSEALHIQKMKEAPVKEKSAEGSPMPSGFEALEASTASDDFMKEEDTEFKL